MARTDSGEVSSLLQEIASTKETARKIANEGPSDGADVPRVLAGLVAHLAEQVERLVSTSTRYEGGRVETDGDRAPDQGGTSGGTQPEEQTPAEPQTNPQQAYDEEDHG